MKWEIWANEAGTMSLTGTYSLMFSITDNIITFDPLYTGKLTLWAHAETEAGVKQAIQIIINSVYWQDVIFDYPKCVDFGWCVTSDSLLFPNKQYRKTDP